MDTMERGDASGDRRKGNVRILYPNQIPGPQSQLMVTKKVEASLQDLVQPLCLIIGSVVVSQCETDLGTEEVAELFTETGGKLWVPAGNILT